MYLHEINEQVRDKIVGLNSEKCLLDNVKTALVHSARTGKVWKFYCVLKTPICKEIAPLKKRLALTKLAVSRSKKFTHICLLCLQGVISLGDKAHEESWNRALCKLATTRNAQQHMTKMHPSNTEVMVYLEEKNNANLSTGALDSGSGAFCWDRGHN